jgi:hypothetical protein
MEKVNINVGTLPNVVCDCGNEFFENLFIVKKLSALQSPTGKEEAMPIPLMICSKCGKSLEEILTKPTLQ